MGLINDVLVSTRAGRTPVRTATELGIDIGLVNGALDHLERLGIVSQAGAATGSPCSACPETEQQAVACAGCFFAEPKPAAGRRRQRRSARVNLRRESAAEVRCEPGEGLVEHFGGHRKVDTEETFVGGTEFGSPAERNTGPAHPVDQI